MWRVIWGEIGEGSWRNISAFHVKCAKFTILKTSLNEGVTIKIIFQLILEQITCFLHITKDMLNLKIYAFNFVAIKKPLSGLNYCYII